MTSLTALLLAASAVLQVPAGLYESADGGFKVAFPAKAKHETRSVKSAAGTIVSHSFVAEKADVTYLVSYRDYPAQVAKADPDRVLDEVADNLLSATKGAKLTVKRDIKIGPNPGKYVQFTYPAARGAAGMGRARLYLAGSRLYTLLAIGPKDEVAKSAQAFMQSFVLSGATASPRGKAGLAKAEPNRGPDESEMPRPKAAPRRPAPAATKAAAHAKPEPFTSEEFGFRVSLPDQPQRQKVAQPSAAGPIDVEVFVVPPGEDGLARVVSVTKLPAADAPAAAVLAGVVRGSVPQGKPLTEKDIRLGAIPGKEFDFEIKGTDGSPAFTRSRAFVSRGRIYQLLLAGPKESVRSPAGTAFFESFALTAP